MGNKAVEFHEEASEEYESAFDWYLERNETVAWHFAVEVDLAIEAISEAPQRWPEGIYGTRKLLLRRFPFVVIYRELPSVIQILAVAHGSRKPGYWKSRV